VALTFKMDGAERANDFPRLEVTIDGERISFLLDSGAAVTLSPFTRQRLSDSGPSTRAASFISARLFNRWRQRHPEWPALPEGDEVGYERAPMIRVPAVTVAGHTLGPVWLVQRSDQSFVELSGVMAGRVEGALGGNGLHELRVTVDYPHGIAVFERP
jgi:hypothetical protein